MAVATKGLVRGIGFHLHNVRGLIWVEWGGGIANTFGHRIKKPGRSPVF